MAGTNDYTVQYNIKVNSESALNGIEKFRQATLKLEQMSQKFVAISNKVTQFNKSLTSLSKGIDISITANTNNATTKLQKICEQIDYIKKNKNLVVTTSVQGAGKNSKTTTSKQSSATTAAAAATAAQATATATTGGNVRTPKPPKAPKVPNSRKNLSYKVLGPSMLDSGGVTAIDMAKGFGIAYGITGLMQGMSNVLQQSVEYDNLMKTTHNILSVHDTGENFEGRFNNMSKIMRQVGVETKFTAPQVADAGKFLAMAGLNIDDISKSMNPIANIALIGDTDLGQTADVVTNIMTGYGMSAGKMSKASDVLTSTFTSANVTLMDLAEAFKYSGTALKKSGASFETSSAAFGILGNAGIKGSQAGTTLRSIVGNFLNPTKKQKETWDSLGLSTRDSKGNMRSMTDIFKDLHDKNLDPAYFYKMFHRTAAIGAMALTDNIDQWNKIIKDNFLSDGLAQQLADEKKNTIQGLWAQLTSAFTEDGIQTFEGMQGEIKNVLKRTIVFFKSPEALTMIQGFASGIKEVGGALVNMALIASKTYNTFRPLFDTWIQMQAYLMPFLMILRSIKAIVNLCMWAYGPISRVVALYKQMIFLSKMSTAVNTVGNLAGVAGAATTGAATIGTEVAGKIAPLIGAAFRPAIIIPAILGTVAFGGALWIGYLTKEAVKARQANEEWAESCRNLGLSMMDLSRPDALLIGNMRIFNNNLWDHNTQIAKSIELYERWRKAKEDVVKIDEHEKFIDTKDGGVFKRDLTNASETYMRWNKLQPLFNQLGGKATSYSGANFNKYGLAIQGVNQEQLGVQMALMNLGADSNNPDKQNLENFLLNHAYSVNNSKDLQQVFNSARKKYIPNTYAKSHNTADAETAKNWSWQDIIHSLSYIKTFQKGAEELISSYEPWGKIVEKLDIGKQADPQIMQDFLFKKFGQIFDPKYGIIGSEGWVKNLNNIATNKDKQFTDVKSAVEYIDTIFEMVLKFFGNVSDKYKPSFVELLNRNLWLSGIPEEYQKYLSSGGFTGGTKPGDTMTKNGVKYTWKTDYLDPNGSMKWLDSKGRQYIPSGDKDGSSGLNGDGTATTKYNGDPYKNHYKNGNAAPKQIIVKIDSLMKVDKIDMADPAKREAAVNNVKRELANALIDVVADFDVSMG